MTRTDLHTAGGLNDRFAGAGYRVAGSFVPTPPVFVAALAASGTSGSAMTISAVAPASKWELNAAHAKQAIRPRPLDPPGVTG